MRVVAFVLLVAVAFAALGCATDEDVPDTRPGPAAVRPSATLFLLPVRGNELIRLDAASGRSEAVRRPELGLGGDPPFRLVRTGGRLVAWGLVGGRVGAVALSDDLNGAARLLGPASFFVPSGTDGRVWLARIDPESPETVKDLGTVVEVDVDGRTTTSAVRPPPGAVVVGAVGDALLFQRDGLELWDPRSDTLPKGRVLGYGPGTDAAVALPVRIDRPIFALVASG